MNFSLSEDQRSLAGLVETIVAGRFPLERIRRAEESVHVVDPDDWAALAEADVFSLRAADSELGLVDAAIVFEELGRGLVPGPLVATHLANGLVAPTAVVGASSSAPGWIEHLGELDALIVDGCRMIDGDALASLVATAVPAGQSLDPLTPMWQVGDLPEGRPVDLPEWTREFRVLTAAQCVGLAAGAAQAAVQYAKSREQFGVAIGSFQAIKHLCADMLVRVDVARAAVHAAALDASDRLHAGAAVLAAEAAVANAASSLQVHGGMGFTWEVPIHLYLMRARVLAASLGSANAMCEEVARAW